MDGVTQQNAALVQQSAAAAASLEEQAQQLSGVFRVLVCRCRRNSLNLPGGADAYPAYEICRPGKR
jgi:hypothetical protein